MKKVLGALTFATVAVALAFSWAVLAIVGDGG